MGYPIEIRAANKQSSRPTKGTRQKPKGWSQEPPPFDPDDLTRRLYAVLAQQKAYADRKTRAKEEAERRALKASSRQRKSEAMRSQKSHSASKPRPVSDYDLRRSASKDSGGSSEPTYHHVPTVAASQFTRTTSQRQMENPLSHRLSRTAIKFHMGGPNASREVAELSADAAPSEQNKALRRAQSQRLKNYDRNQFQQAQSLQPTLETNEQDNEKSDRNTFDAQLRPKWVNDDEVTASRRQSTGAIISRTLGLSPRNPSDAWDNVHSGNRQDGGNDYELAAHAGEHRVDWTQSDETIPRTTIAAPRKHESRWNLRAMIGGSQRHGKTDKSAINEDNAAAVGETEKPRGGFFARFKH